MTVTNEEASDKLYKKMAAEQASFREWLMTRPPEEILSHAHEYSLREDILSFFRDDDLECLEAKALLRKRSPLADIYREWEKDTSRHMGNILDTMIDCAQDAMMHELAEHGQER